MVVALDETDAQSILECKKLLDNCELKISLSFIAANFDIVSTAIEKLETRGLSLESAISSIEAVKNRLETLDDPRYSGRLNSVLEKNPPGAWFGS